MNAVTPDDVRVFVREFLAKRATASQQNTIAELPDSFDLLLSGAIDSLGLLELITALNQHYGRDLDFEALDAEQMTIIGPLCRFVADHMATS